NIDGSLDQCIDVLLTPAELYASRQHRMRERIGSAETKEEELLRILRSSRDELKRYRDFLDGLPFDAIRFDSDGSSEIVPRTSIDNLSYLDDEFEDSDQE
ncbi:MAG TPA: hypothetical protein VFY65_05695, partial [Longimicrobium sp.]|nr:hypothetical protein [Longimicrobium sp.]